MNRTIILLYLIFLCFPVFAKENDQDAVIIYNNEDQTYGISKLESNLYGIEILIKTSRRIKVLSVYGLEQFATMYIPTYKDLDFKTEIVNLKAQTIKASGEKFVIPNEAIKETTLPANVPFLRNYKGKVKALAFENLEVGDEIQYDFQIKYTSSSTSPNLYNSIKKLIPEEYKMLVSSYTFHLKNDVQFKGVLVNEKANFKSEKQLEKGTTSYSLTLKDIPPYKSDIYSIDEENIPYFIVDIFKIEDYTPYEKWEDITNDIKVSRKSSIFFVGKSVNDFYKESQNEPTPTKKIMKIHDLMMSEMKKVPEKIHVLYKNYQADLEDANQLFKLLKLLEINGGVLLVKNKRNGTVNKDFVSLRQFDDFLVEFEEKGKTHYLALFDPYASLDEINALYQGTEALKLAVINKKESVSFVKVPVQTIPKNTTNYKYDIQLKYNEGTTTFTTSLQTKKSGQFYLEDRIDYMLEETDNKFNTFSNDVKSEFKNSFPECKVDTIILSKNTSQIDFQTKYQYKIYAEYPGNMFDVKISDLFYSNLLTQEYKKDRATKAIFPYCYEISRKFILKTEGGYVVTPNLLLKRNFNNEFAFLNIDFTIPEPNTIEISLNYGIKQTELLPSQWPLFLNFIDIAHEVLAQNILFQK